MPSKRFQKKQPVPDIITLLNFLFKEKLIGTLLIALGIITIPGLFELNTNIEVFPEWIIVHLGILSYLVSAMIITTGILLFIQEYKWFKLHFRHILGVVLILFFMIGFIGLFNPDHIIDNISLSNSSLTGEAGLIFNNSSIRQFLWIISLFTGFSLVWPKTSIKIIKRLMFLLKRYVTFRNIVFLNKFIYGILLTFSQIVIKIISIFIGIITKFVKADKDEYDEYENNVLTTETSNIQEEFPERPKTILQDRKAEESTAANNSKEAEKTKQIKMDFATSVEDWRHTEDGWQLPPLDVLSESPLVNNEKIDNEARATLIIDTLSSFGVDAKVVEINEGPTVTQFGVEPGWDIKEKITPKLKEDGTQITDKNGNPEFETEILSKTRIRVNRITALQNDLALALATPSLRIEAPVPGKPIVGIEVPNSLNSIVNLKQLIANEKFHKFKSDTNLPVALGQGVSGEPLLIDLAKMPHLLIAGATGSGKSVCLAGIISCLLMNHSPSDLRFILIDPKRVELTQFAKIPHLAFSDIVVETDKVVSTLRAVINEMDNRYKKFGSVKVRNIQSYNEKFPEDKLPYWTVIVDELADLMLSAPFEVETQLVRLAQLARATGIHLIIATQRPSVDVITGLIKANFPTRIAFAVTSQIDSRTVIDSAGAEKLLGRGDMLFLSPSAQKPKRIQGVYVDDSEIEKIVQFWTDDKFDDMHPDKQDHLIIEASMEIQKNDGGKNNQSDELMPQVIELITELDTVSVSLLQRKLRIGYPRAARLMDELEEKQIVSPAEKGQNLRKVLQTNNAPEEDIASQQNDLSQKFDN
tara:strand:+ start:4136 stop:6571 length:2436 start_codon:yes stop_codon:yes gene_type:complete